MPSRRGGSLVGLLVTVVCMAVLFVILMNALSTRMGGGSNQTVQPGTVASAKDRLNLYSLSQSMAAHAEGAGSRFLVPSHLSDSRGRDQSVDTTAALFSAMIMQRYISPEQLISDNEQNWEIYPDEDYNFNAYDPASGVFWDPGFQADLKRLSNTSYAHLPLFGERFEQHWHAFGDSRFPVLGSRGPRGGIADPQSNTCDEHGQWAGHMIFGDSHVEFIDTFTPGVPASGSPGETAEPDNIFRMQQGEGGADAVIAFTELMTSSGPLLQFD